MELRDTISQSLLRVLRRYEEKLDDQFKPTKFHYMGKKIQIYDVTVILILCN